MMITNHPTNFTFIQIHGSGENPNYQIPWGASRQSFYAIAGYPTAWFDGKVKCEGAYTNDTQQYNWYNTTYNGRMNVPTDVSITLGAEPLGGQSFRIHARVSIDKGGTAKTLRIYMVHALDNYPNSTDHRYRNCLRLPTVTTQDITLAAGQHMVVDRDFTFDSTSWGKQSDIRIVVWAQQPLNAAPAEIYNSRMLSWPFPELPPLPGDLNCDDVVDFGDIDPFVLALSDPDEYEIQFPDCNILAGDCNGDGAVNFGDIDPFVALLTG